MEKKDFFEGIEISPTMKCFFEKMNTENVVDLYAELENQKSTRIAEGTLSCSSDEFRELESCIRMCEMQIINDALRKHGWEANLSIRYIKKSKGNKE